MNTESARFPPEQAKADAHPLDKFVSLSSFDHGFDPHAQRTRWLAERLSRYCGLPSIAAERIGRAAQFHDIGKRFLPDLILEKPGPLTSAERHLITRHAKLGAGYLRVVSEIFGVDLLLHYTIARSHHERWDGMGYPDGAPGLSIPFPARIVAVADVFDALASERSYKRAWPLDDVFAYVREEKGRQFDPLCAKALQLCAGEIRDGWEISNQPRNAELAPRWTRYLDTCLVHAMIQSPTAC